MPDDADVYTALAQAREYIANLEAELSLRPSSIDGLVRIDLTIQSTWPPKSEERVLVWDKEGRATSTMEAQIARMMIPTRFWTAWMYVPDITP